MLIGICGSICSGKKTVAQYLVDHHGFRRLYLRDDAKEVNGARENPIEDAAAPATDSSSAAAQGGDSSRSLAMRGRPDSHTFDTAEALLDFVTVSWRSRFVTTDIPTEKVLDVFLRRPFFMLISTDAPLLARWRRHTARAESSSPSSLTGGARSALSLEDFAAASDAHLYCPSRGLQPLISRATVRLLNTSPSLAHLYATLGKLDVPNPERLRPGWDAYFMSLAALAARRSNCMKRRVGCVLVGAGRRVVSTGYNGTPRGLRNCADGGCPRCNGGGCASGVGLATCLCLHAEENALLEAGRERIRPGAVLYCDTCPCLTCSIKICQVGIDEVVYARGYSMDAEAAAVFREAGVKLRQFTPPPNGSIHLEKMDMF
ncbi:Cytidine deaminase [Cordyceps fumosorosea ARSEF 2679]|uniref:Deoxycytidylate deaminase n=1 Tax=Cordyceps fumosorosea (strain ARSEF 2679) TaxID=1081104 RepID=A0A167VUW2_CORFA|nr:Cytidine deaminase [Cordyceps fumosorosea ARSEF 2679]OAA63005.1 Cytidine deaminase [Cordyceps fumosorosea ARSEF 2679]